MVNPRTSHRPSYLRRGAEHASGRLYRFLAWEDSTLQFRNAGRRPVIIAAWLFENPEGRGLRRKKLTTTSRSTRSVFVSSGAAFLLIVAALASGCGGEEEQSGGSSEEEVAEQSVAVQETGSEETESTQAQTPEEQSAEGSDATIGETVTLGKVQWMVTDAEQSEELLSIKGDYEEGNFVIVDVTFANGSNQDITLATPFLTVVDSDGNEFEAGIENNFTFLYPEENMFVDPVEPGTAKEGKVIFSIEPNSSDLKLRVGEANFASDASANIDLGLS